MNNKNFLNDNGGGAVGLLVLLMISLTFSSFVIVFMITQIYGVSVTGNMAGVILPSGDQLNASQDYVNNSYDYNVNFVNGLGTYVYVPSVGMVLTTISDNPILLVKGVLPVNNVYTVRYHLNNTVKQDYIIYARYWQGDSLYSVEVKAEDDGFHVRHGGNIVVETAFYSYPNANKEDYPNIKTIWDENTQTLQFYDNEVFIFEDKNFWKPWVIVGTTYYAGVSSQTVGFTVESINGGGFVSNPTDLLSQLGSTIDVMSRVVLWGVPEQYLPLIFSIILIRTQEAGIILCVLAIYFRGVG